MTCPNGITTRNRWEDRSPYGAAVVRARFPTAACRPCKARDQCTCSHDRSDIGRWITLRRQAEQEVIQQTRPQGNTPERKEQYAHRVGVEGRSPREYEFSTCGDAGITAYPRPSCDTSSPRPR
ncbi:transposase [Streptomyces sp. NPDC093071]|uniref:transposase n=1 Tax=Streptomyces sp. NPDC093071 TaxID=3366022 RepID=UPI0037FA4E8D